MSTAQDQARASVLVRVDRERAFRLFTEEIDRWWRRGLKYRVAGKRRGIIALEPRVGGRLFESFDVDGETRVTVSGQVTAWEPPARLMFEWRAVNFAPSESTEVEVRFEPDGESTLVTVTHRGWSKIRPDHPARHGLAPAAFLRMMGMWWADLLSSARVHAAGGSR
ncbi:MAG TPA: SRPBCC domain-containing protein [Polyangiaceae bacterium]